MSRVALIDGDILLYRASAAVQTHLYLLRDQHGNPIRASHSIVDIRDYASVYLEEGMGEIESTYRIDEDSWDLCQLALKKQIESIMSKTKCDSYIVFVSGKNNFRYDVYPDYKGNRSQPKPLLYKALHDLMIQDFSWKVVDGMEADDALGIEQLARFSESDDNDHHRMKCNSVIVSIDKDLLMIPGDHYNFVKDVFTYVDDLEGMKFFYRQLLTGDPTDNIKGVKGIGAVKAGKLIDHCTTELEMYEACKEAWEDEEEMLISAQLLWILRDKDKGYEVPVNAEEV